MSIAAPIPRATMTRDELVRLGQSRAGTRPWDFLPLAVQALRQIPGDIGLRLITVSSLVRLGLKTAALDHLSLIPEQVLQSPEVSPLMGVLRAMPSDVLDTRERIATCRANLAALGDPVPRANVDRWAESAADTLFCRASDGNIISRPAGGSAADWRNLSDQRQALTRVVQEHFAPGSPDQSRPVYIEGIDPPWLLLFLAEARPREATGHLPPITILQADTQQFLDGLSQADLRSVFLAGNITALVGPDASHQLAARLRERANYQLSGPSLTTIATRTRCSPPLPEVLHAASKHQEQLAGELLRQASDAYPPRPIEYWKFRFTKALSGGEPLRILIPTTRYSTFIQHASRDLARALNSRGQQARILIEPDDSTKFVTYAYLAEILDFRPDLIITINYPRASISESIPANIPFVCWLQDAMPHLFSPTLGAAQGPLDFLAGHLFDELFTRHGYPREHAMPAAIVADETKFHPGPRLAAGTDRFTCDIAYVSHQSETPEAQHARLCAEFKKLGIASALDRLRPLLETDAFKPLSVLKITDTRELAAQALREELGREADPGLIDVVQRSYCQPVIDRLIRHQTLQWAADIADHRGWKLRLYGKGWENHARFSRYASGPLDHGDDLRSSYRAAGVHLHMMAHALVHQRLIECILSGGFPLCRLHAPERWAIVETLTRLGVAQGARPLDSSDPNIPARRRLTAWTEAPALMHLASALQRLGIFEDAVTPVGGCRQGPLIDEQEWLRRGTLAPHEPDLWSAFGLLGQCEQFMFHTPESLEARIEFARVRPDLRHSLSAAARTRFQSKFTYDGFATRLLEFVRDSLGNRP